MSKVQLAAAKALIEEKRYDEARALLETIDHPTATKWLGQLDKLAPVAAPKKKRSKFRWAIVGGFLVACIAVYAVGSNPEVAGRFNATETARAVAALGTEDARNASRGELTRTAAARAANIALTPSATITETLTPTITETPTITRTVLPSATPAPTLAPEETWYTQNTANVRACAKTDCERVIQLPAGSAIIITGWVQGENYNGSDIWRRVSYNGQEAYVHSSLVAVTRPMPTSAPIVQSTVPPPVVNVAPAPQTWQCGGDIYNCGDFSSRSEMFSYFNTCPGDPSDLDGNDDGEPCES